MGHRRKKGEYGYREYRRKVQVGEGLFGAVMILVQLGARQFTDSQAVKNVLTVMAILSVLPTANVASPLLAAWRYKTPPRSFLERVQVYESKFPVLYDLILTSKEAIMPVDAAAVHRSVSLLHLPEGGRKKGGEIFKRHVRRPPSGSPCADDPGGEGVFPEAGELKAGIGI